LDAFVIHAAGDLRVEDVPTRRCRRIRCACESASADQHHRGQGVRFARGVPRSRAVRRAVGLLNKGLMDVKPWFRRPFHVAMVAVSSRWRPTARRSRRLCRTSG